MKSLKSLLLGGVLLSLFSCYVDKEEILYPSSFECNSTTTTSYSEDIAPILDVNCYSCHRENVYQTLGSGINLSDYNVVASKATDGSLLGSVSHESDYTAMPLNGEKLSDCKIELIQKWINDGAQNN